MNQLITCALVALTLVLPHSSHAQLVWIHQDSTQGIRRGNYIFPSPGGVYVITDQSSPADPGSSGGATSVLHYSSKGTLLWKKKISRGTPDFEKYGFLFNPTTDLKGNLVFGKLKVINDFLWSNHIEKIEPDGTNLEINVGHKFGGTLDFDLENNVYQIIPNGAGVYLYKYAEDLSALWNTPLEGNSKLLRVLNAQEFYQIGSYRLDADSNIQICNQKVTPNGDNIWETCFEPSQPVAYTDFLQTLAHVVDAQRNIILLLSVTHPDDSNDYYISKTSADGQVLWTRKMTAAGLFAKNTLFSGARLLADENGGIYLAGTLQNSIGSYDAFVSKFSGTGTLVWSRKMAYTINAFQPPASALYDIFYKQGNLYLTGWYGWSYNINGVWKKMTDQMALKINANSGALGWKATFLDTAIPEPIQRQGKGIFARNDSVFVTGVAFGDSSSEVLTTCYKYHQDVKGNLIDWVPFQIDITSRTSEALVGNASLSVFPNPVEQTFQIQIPAGITPFYLNIFGADGRLVMSQQDQLDKPIDVGQLSPGMYFLVLETNEGAISGKMVRIR